MKVVIPQDITSLGKDFLKERGYEIVIGDGNTDEAAMCELVKDADAILARTALYPKAVIDAAPRLKVIGRHGIGVDNIDVEYCTSKGIWVTFAPNSNAVSVAEHTIGMMIGAAHNFARFDAGVRKGEWAFRNSYKGVDLEGKTLGVIGLGRIGRMVAEKCRAAFNMKVYGFDAMIEPAKYPEGVIPASSPQDIFKKADFITLHVPATPETRGLINAENLALMKPTAFVINCARGEVVNEKDLYEALKNGVIRGAAIDVFSPEPPEKDNPLFTLQNILLTPHSAALTQESMDRMGLHAAMGIHSVLSGQAPDWPVNHPAD